MPFYIVILSIDKTLLTNKIMERRDIMEKYVCTVCGYVYDPEENGGVSFEDLEDDYVCPLCGVGKDMFTQQ